MEQALLGRLPAETALMVEMHIEACEKCLVIARELSLHDEALSALRQHVICGDPHVEHAETARRLMLRLVGRSPPTIASLPDGHVDQRQNSTPAALSDAVAEDADTVVPQEAYDFLAPAAAPDEIGRLDRYRVLRVIGEGGMGVVFEADDTKLARRVALKTMKPALAASTGYRRRFEREARAASALADDHIVTIFDVGEDRGIPFLSMELLEGESLSSRLRRVGRLPPADAARIGRDVALGLAAAHARGLVHRDIKARQYLVGKSLDSSIALRAFRRAAGAREDS